MSDYLRCFFFVRAVASQEFVDEPNPAVFDDQESTAWCYTLEESRFIQFSSASDVSAITHSHVSSAPAAENFQPTDKNSQLATLSHVDSVSTGISFILLMSVEDYTNMIKSKGDNYVGLLKKIGEKVSRVSSLEFKINGDVFFLEGQGVVYSIGATFDDKTISVVNNKGLVKLFNLPVTQNQNFVAGISSWIMQQSS